MSRRDHCSSANDIVIKAWRYARSLGRTSAERTEMARLERRCADLTHEYAKRRLSVRHPLCTRPRRKNLRAARRGSRSPSEI